MSVSQHRHECYGGIVDQNILNGYVKLLVAESPITVKYCEVRVLAKCHKMRFLQRDASDRVSSPALTAAHT